MATIMMAVVWLTLAGSESAQCLTLGGGKLTVPAQLSPLPAQRAQAVSAIGIEAPPLVHAAEGDSISITARAGSGDPHSLLEIRVSGQPPGLTLVVTGGLPRFGTLSGTLDYDSQGTWIVSWTVRDQFGAYDSTTTQLIVEDRDNDIDDPPIADAGGPYSGLTGSPISMAGSASYDPEGNELSYSWDFGDGLTGAGETVSHVYSSTGLYHVKLVVSDGLLAGEDQTTAITFDALGFDVFVTGGDKVLRLKSSKPFWCVSLEPTDGYLIEHVDLTSIQMVYGSSRIPAVQEKVTRSDDRNRNGIEEITACFGKPDLRSLFANVPAGTNAVTVSIQALHGSGNPISGDLLLTVIADSPHALSIAPNPLNPRGAITFTITVAGMVRIDLLDVSGRLVRTVLESHLEVGSHVISFDAQDRAGSALGSGVYFLRIRDQEGVRARRVVIAK